MPRRDCPHPSEDHVNGFLLECQERCEVPEELEP